MRILIFGGAGFIGSNLSDRLLDDGHEVVVVDNLSSGVKDNLSRRPRMLFEETRMAEFIESDACGITPAATLVGFDRIYYLASPASPKDYAQHPIETWKVNTLGLQNVLDLAMRLEPRPRVLFTSTSEIYGDPLLSPQPEGYFGNVNSWGPRACYDESKRAGEAIAWVYKYKFGLDVRVARLFNSYGPRIRPGDGRVVSNFICSVLRGEPLVIYGEGTQTRSLCYVSDTVDGLVKLMEIDGPPDGPVNLGNPNEMHTVLDLAYLVAKVADKPAILEFKPLPQDDPRQRQPDITLARKILGWEPKVQLEDGLASTIGWLEKELSRSAFYGTSG